MHYFILDYGTVVWCPHTATNVYLVERVQRRFLQFARFKPEFLICPMITHLLLNILNWIQIQCWLVDHRMVFGTEFLKKFLDSKVDSPSPLSLINFKVSQRQSKYHALIFLSFLLYKLSTNLTNNLDVLWKCQREPLF